MDGDGSSAWRLGLPRELNETAVDRIVRVSLAAVEGAVDDRFVGTTDNLGILSPDDRTRQTARNSQPFSLVSTVSEL
jgi:hypothetical protein